MKGVSRTVVTLDEIILFRDLLLSYDEPLKIFGQLKGSTEDQLRQLRSHYRKAVRICHPDLCGHLSKQGQDIAEEAYKHIQELYERAVEQIEKGIYGKPNSNGSTASAGTNNPTVITTQNREYRILSHLAEGDYTSVYLGEFDNANGIQRVAVKIVLDPADNDLMEREITVLQRCQHKHLPVLLETFTTSRGQIAEVLEYIDGVDLVTVKEKYPNGVPQEHVCWILERLLSGLVFLHQHGIFHGNITPDNILVRPRDHNAFLIDFLGSVVDPNASNTFVAATPVYTPPEAYQKKPPIEGSDIYSLGKCMIYLLGGDVSTNKLPAFVDRRLALFLGEFVVEDPLSRPQNASVLWHRLSDLRKELFGARRQFLEFKV